MNEFRVRRATHDDLPVLVDFNDRLAEETESKQLDLDTLRSGIAALLSDPQKGRYFVACQEETVVGQAMHTWEWSDWRNGQIWWLQSVYIAPEFRQQGVFRLLFKHLLSKAESDPNVVGLRLYVENENAPAQATYERLGLLPTSYSVMECLFQPDHSVNKTAK